MKRIYKIKRDYGEYVNYSAHLSDYLFTTNINSLIHQSSIMARWNRFDKHVIGGKAAFPGFLFSLLFVFGLIRHIKIKKKIDINLDLNRERFFFLTLILMGLAFSLGPRLNFNGIYAQIPTPYTVLMKFPILEVMRAPCRWSFVFYLGIIYFALYFLKKLNIQNKRNLFLIFMIIIVFLLECAPINIKTHKENYLTNDYEILRNICKKEKKVLLEIPVTHFFVKQGIIKGLNYVTKVQLASIYHGCYLVNGYSGYDLPELVTIDVNLNDCFENNNCYRIRSQLDKMKIDIVKFNKKELRVIVPPDFLERLSMSKASLDKSSDLYQPNH